MTTQVTDPVGQEPQRSTRLTRTNPVPPCRISRADLLSLFDGLSAKATELGESEVRQLVQRAEWNDDQFEEIKSGLRDAHKLSISVTTKSGETYFSNTREIFENLSREWDVQSIYIDNFSRYQALVKSEPRSKFHILFDFTNPSPFDFGTPVSDPTPNNSNYKISGSEDTWVRGVFDQLNTMFDAKKTHRSWIHARHSYDLLLWLAVVPVALYMIQKYTPIYENIFPNSSSIMNIFAGVYALILSMISFRVLFQYTRWVYPKVELADIGQPRWGGHRAFWFVLVLTVLASTINSLRKALF